MTNPLDPVQEVYRITDLVMSIQPVKNGPLNLMQAKGRNLRWPRGGFNSGPLRVRHGWDGGTFYADVDFEHRNLRPVEMSRLYWWCKEFAEAFKLSGTRFVFQDENDMLAFKMRWAGMNAADFPK